MQRRREAEQHPGQQAHPRHEREHAGVHREGHPVRLPDVLRFPIEPPDENHGEAETDNAADEGQEHALDEQLTNDPPPRRAEGHAHGDLPGAMGRAGQQQVGDVRAGDQQHERDRAHERPEDGFDLRANDAIQKRRDHRRDALVAVLVLLRELRGDVAKLAARLLERHAIGQAAVSHEGPLLPWPPEHGRPLRHRHPDLALERPLEPVGHDADDRGGDGVDADGFADDGRIGRVP